MLGAHYLVDIDMRVRGAPDQQLGRVGGSLDRLHGKASSLRSELASVGAKFADGFTGGVERIAGSLSTLAKVGIAGALGAVTYGVVGLNRELETAQTSIGAVLNAQGVTGNMEDALQRATGLVSQMRKDARELPGEFSDLFGIFQSGLGSALNAGMSDTSFERLSAQAMAAGKALAVPLDQTGRELALLLEGRAGAHNKFGLRLGINAHETYQDANGTSGTFNQLSGAGRVKVITEALEKFQPAIAAFGKTFDAQSSTFVDNVKMFIGASTKDLFGRVTGALGEINAWFDNNQATVGIWAQKVSSFLVHAWDGGRAAFEKWWPSIATFAENLYDKFVSIWHDAEPYVKRIGEYVKGMLDNPESVDKLITLLKLYAAVKVGGVALGVGSSVASLAGASGISLSGIGSGIGGALSGAGSAVAGAAAGIGGGALTVGAIVTATLAAMGAAGYEIYSANRAAETVNAKGGGAYGYSAGEQQFVNKQVDSGIRAALAVQGIRGKYDAMRPSDAMPEWDPARQAFESYMAEVERLKHESAVANDRIDAFGQAAVEASDAASELAFVMNSLAKSGDFEAIAKINEAVMAKAQEAAFAADDSQRNQNVLSTLGTAAAVAAVKKLDAAKAASDKAKKSAEGRTVMNINRVEITVSSNQAPGQIARDVVRELGSMKRFRGSSPNVPNFTTGR